MKSVKKVTPFQWACYDLLCSEPCDLVLLSRLNLLHTSEIPDGTVTTYAAIAKTLNSSPRAGQSLSF